MGPRHDPPLTPAGDTDRQPARIEAGFHKAQRGSLGSETPQGPIRVGRVPEDGSGRRAVRPSARDGCRLNGGGGANMHRAVRRGAGTPLRRGGLPQVPAPASAQNKLRQRPIRRATNSGYMVAETPTSGRVRGTRTLS